VDVEIIPNLLHKSEEYVVGRITQRNNKHCMLETYSKLQWKTKGLTKFSHHNLGLVFHQYLEQLHNIVPNFQGSLTYIIHQFTTSYNLPMANEDF